MKTRARLLSFAIGLALILASAHAATITYNAQTNTLTTLGNIALGYNAVNTITISIFNGIGYQNTTFTVSSPLIAQHQYANKTFTPSSSLQCYSTTINNVSVNLCANAITKGTPMVNLTFGSQSIDPISNTIYNAPKAKQCAISKTVTPLWGNSITLYNSTASCFLNVTVAAIAPLGINATVTPGANAITLSNSVVGYSYTIRPVTQAPAWNATLQANVNASIAAHDRQGLSMLEAFVTSANITVLGGNATASNTLRSLLAGRIVLAGNLTAGAKGAIMLLRRNDTNQWGAFNTTLTTTQASLKYSQQQDSIDRQNATRLQGQLNTATGNANLMGWAWVAIYIALILLFWISMWNTKRIGQYPPFASPPEQPQKRRGLFNR